jgi:copper chaperone CopZ
MCCILPLGLGALGLSTSVVSAFFEPLRPWLLSLAALLLGIGFYFAFRKPAQGEVCNTDSQTLPKLSKPALWVSTAVVVALALFPSISGIAAGGSEELAPATVSRVVVLRIESMTCESCVPAVRTALLDVPGVIDAAVSYQKKSAHVRVRAERPPETSALVAAVEKAGYTGALDSP